MIYAITQFVNFDVDKEKERIEKCFKGATKQRQLNILQLFLDGKYKECFAIMNKLPYDSESECDELEYVCPFIYETIRNLNEMPNIKIEPICQ